MCMNFLGSCHWTLFTCIRALGLVCYSYINFVLDQSNMSTHNVIDGFPLKALFMLMFSHFL